MINNIINDLNNIKEHRRRYYTKVYIQDVSFSLSFKLLYVESLDIIDNVLVVRFSDDVFKFTVSDNLSVTYIENTPVEEDNRRIKRRRR